MWAVWRVGHAPTPEARAARPYDGTRASPARAAPTLRQIRPVWAWNAPPRYPRAPRALRPCVRRFRPERDIRGGAGRRMAIMAIIDRRIESLMEGVPLGFGYG